MMRTWKMAAITAMALTGAAWADPNPRVLYDDVINGYMPMTTTTAPTTTAPTTTEPTTVTSATEAAGSTATAISTDTTGLRDNGTSQVVTSHNNRSGLADGTNLGNGSSNNSSNNGGTLNPAGLAANVQPTTTTTTTTTPTTTTTTTTSGHGTTTTSGRGNRH